MSNHYEKYTAQLKKCFDFVGAQNSESEFVLLKGSSYKIKQYYLEDNSARDIRGASMLLDYVEEKVIPNYIAAKLCRECIIYSGGGNILCILPKDVEENFALELEKEAKKYLISANCAYVVMKVTKGEIEKDYKNVINRLEQKLADRKKLKLFNCFESESPFENSGIPWRNGEYISISAKKYSGKRDGVDVCDMCKSRIPSYVYGSKCVCGSCLHKRIIGEYSVNKFAEEYKKYNHTEPFKPDGKNDSFGYINNEHIAVVYGDGNNMGQIIQNFTDIKQMMQFSENVKEAAKKSVYEAMGECGIRKFAVVGLGGDDIFVIVSGDIAMQFAVKLNKKYSEIFNAYGGDYQSSTMSVGVCIAKPDTPLRVMLETAEDKLSEAKEIAKNANIDTPNGTISFAVMNDPTEECNAGTAGCGLERTLAPYTTKGMDDLLNVIKKLSGKSTAIRNIYDAYTNAESIEEAELFFKYRNAKENKDDKKIEAPKIDGWSYSGGKYTRDGKNAFIWNDVLELYKYAKESLENK